MPGPLIVLLATSTLSAAPPTAAAGFSSGEFETLEEPGFAVDHQHCDGSISTATLLPLPKPLGRKFAGTEVTVEAALDAEGRPGELEIRDGHEPLLEELSFSLDRTRFAPGSPCVRMRIRVTDTVVKEADIIRLRPWADVAIDPRGTVTEVTFGTEVHPAVAAALERQVAGWDFEPAEKDGQPAARTTSVLLEAELVPDGPDRWTLTSERLMTGPRLVRRTATQWPRRGAGAGVPGLVRLSFVVDKKGRPQDIAILEADPPTVFDRAARGTVKKWRYKPETVAGKPVRSQPLEVLIDFDPRRAAANAGADPHARTLAKDRLDDLERMWDQAQMMRDRQRLTPRRP
jgi:TonB family protein